MMALLNSDGCRIQLTFCHDDEGAVIAAANKACDGLDKNVATFTNIASGRSLIWSISALRKSSYVRLFFRLP